MIEYLSTSYYTSLLNVFSAIAFLVFLFKAKSNIPLKTLFLLYAIISITQSMYTIITESFNPMNLKSTTLYENMVNIFSIVEIFLLTLFYYHILQKTIFKASVMFLSLSLIAWMGYIWIILKGFNNVVREITVIQSFFIIIYSLFYFYEILKSREVLKLQSSSTFWIATGFFLLSSFLFPLFLFLDQILKILPNVFYGIYSVNNIAYFILFICLIKATLCQPKLAN
jgi:hypothetical protein